MSVGEFLIAWKDLAGNADLRALIGDRFSPWDAVRTIAFPRIVYAKTFGELINTLKRPTSLRRTEVQLDVQARTDAVAEQVAAKLIGDPDNGDLRLAGYSGSIAGITVQGCHLENELDMYEPPTSQPDGIGVYRVILSFVVWWTP